MYTEFLYTQLTKTKVNITWFKKKLCQNATIKQQFTTPTSSIKIYSIDQKWSLKLNCSTDLVDLTSIYRYSIQQL